MKTVAPAIVIPIVVALLYIFVPGSKEQPWTVLRICGAVVAVSGYILVTIARVQLGDSFTVQPEARELVTHGFYRRIRNPMYVFVDIMFLGLIFVFQTYWFLVALATMVIVQTMQSRREAKVLHAKFGQAYAYYRAGTWF